MYPSLTTFRPRLLLYTSYLFFDYHQCCSNSTPTIYGCSVLVKSVQRECISSSDFYPAVTSSTQSPHVHQSEYVTQQSPRKTSTFVSMLCMGMQLTLSFCQHVVHGHAVDSVLLGERASRQASWAPCPSVYHVGQRNWTFIHTSMQPLSRSGVVYRFPRKSKFAGRDIRVLYVEPLSTRIPLIIYPRLW